MKLSSQSIFAREIRGLNPWVRLALSLAGGALLGAGLASLSPGQFWTGWFVYALLLVPTLFCLLWAWEWGTHGAACRSDVTPERTGVTITANRYDRTEGRLLALLVALAFLLRLGAGVGLSLALPAWGYAEKEQQAGYLFKDAYFRDSESWTLAQSGKPLWASFREQFSTDQYGGLLALSALVYRYLSPDAHRPFLILILGSFFAALGVPFLWRAARLRWCVRAAALATWIYVLYPDAIFFSSSQMREPFLMGLVAVAFWAVLDWGWRKKASWLALVGSLLGMALISNRVAAAAAGILGLLFLLEYVVACSDRRLRVLGWVGLAAGVVIVLVFSWEWFRSSSNWDLLLTWRGSGTLARQIKLYSKSDVSTMAILLGYGVTQPVLPAAVAETKSIPLWKTIAIVRSVGWYALAPFLIYGLFSIWKERDPAMRRRIIWLALVVFVWVLIASARGGADQTDNPRYRSIFIAWFALLAAWAVDWALGHRDAWLWRWIGVEVIFLGFFTHWYVGKYYKLWIKLDFRLMAALIVGFSVILLVGGWVWDRFLSKKWLSSNKENIGWRN